MRKRPINPLQNENNANGNSESAYQFVSIKLRYEFAFCVCFAFFCQSYFIIFSFQIFGFESAIYSTWAVTDYFLEVSHLDFVIAELVMEINIENNSSQFVSFHEAIFLFCQFILPLGCLLTD